MAKTLWIFITRRTQGFEGQYTPDGTISIAKYAATSYIAPLEELLASATEHEPGLRPSMAEFADRLRTWLRIDAAFPERNRLEWIDVQARLFPVNAPTRATWTAVDAIVQVLNILGARSNMNHLFFPSGGGLDLHRAVRSRREPGCIEIVTNGITGLVKPKVLMFESFGADPQFNYFRLEADTLAPSGVYDDLGDYAHEELTDVAGRRYADRSCWDANEFDGEELPENSRTLTRYFGGAFVIVQKTSIYNRISSTYDGRHSKMDSDVFREYIEAIIKIVAEESGAEDPPVKAGHQRGKRVLRARKEVDG